MRISVFTLLAVGLVGLALRWASSSTPYQAIDHPLLNDQFLLVAKGGGEYGPENSLEFLKKARSISPDLVVKIDIMMSRDAHLVLYGKETLEEATTGQGFVQATDWVQLQKLHYKGTEDSKILRLEEYFELFPQGKTLINIAEQDPARIFSLLDVVEKHNQQDRVIFMSDYPEPLKYLRRKSPRSLFSLPRTDLVQINVMASLFLEPLSRIKADLVVAPLEYKPGKSSLSPRVIKEISRRQIKLVLDHDGPIPQWLEGHLGGVVTTTPENYLANLLAPRKNR